MDREVERRGHAFCRYADDVQVYVRSQRAGQRVLAPLTRFLERTLRLKDTHAKSAVARTRERTFLRYRIQGRVQAGLGIALERVKRAKDTIRRITKRNRGVTLDRVLRELRTFTAGWEGYFWVARTPSVFQALDEWVRRHLRCYQWKQWKTRRRRARELRKAGIGPWLAWGTASAGPGFWRAAGSPALTPTHTNARLTHLGFHSLHERYQALAAG